MPDVGRRDANLFNISQFKDVVRKKWDYVGKIPNWEGGSDPNPLLDVYVIYLKL